MKLKIYFPNDPIALFDDSDIAKRYGKKFENLDKVIDASDPDKKIVNGYHVSEAVVLTKNEKQPISLYSNIYSCLSNSFKRMNDYTFKSIDKVRNVLDRKCNMIFDRGYDNNRVIDYVDKNGDYFVIKMKENKNFLFKEKIKNCYNEAIKRNGKNKDGIMV